jgi:signal transduction histidine kinase
MARLRQINFVVDLPEAMEGQSWLDGTLLQRVVDNLLSNAFKFSSAGDTVTLRVDYPQINDDTSPSKPAIRIKVFDEGPGISDEDRERIFDKFEVVALRRANVSQVGLGLAFCKFVVEAHGGRIWVEANQPQGCVFTVEI